MPAALDTVEEFWTWEQVEQSRAIAGDSSREAFAKDFSCFIGVDADRVHLMPSGHQGLEWLLRARLDSRRCVMLPAFNCSVVQDAVTSAGLDSQLYDFSSKPGVFDWGRVIDEITPNVGVLIVTHYFGVPIDFRPVFEYCVANGITIIEDCAHTLGGTVAGQQVGTLADAAIFSFNYDKPISLGWGGVAVINNPSAFDATRSSNYQVPQVEEEMALLRQFVLAKAQHRRMIPYQNFLLIRVLRRLRLLSPIEFSKSSDISIGAVQAELGRWCLARYPQISQSRNRNAQVLDSLVALKTWPVDANVIPAWLKQKICVPNTNQQRWLSGRFQRKGIRIGNFNWPRLLKDLAPTKYIHASDAATNWIDVPVHQNISESHMNQIVSVLKDAE